MLKDLEQEASQPPCSLAAFARLVGEWAMVGTHPELPSAVHGRSTFEWLRDGALLAWHFDWDSHQGVPSAFSVIGQDDDVGPCSTLYTDERGVSRLYKMRMAEGVWTMWRDAPGFSQRMRGTFSDDGNTITWQGELSRDGSTWEPDLNVTFTRKQ